MEREVQAPTPSTDRLCTPVTADSTKSSEGSALPAIIGGVVGGCLLLLLLLLLVLWRRRKSKDIKTVPRKSATSTKDTDSPLYVSPGQLELEHMERRGMSRQSSFYASIAALPDEERARALKLLEESDEIGTDKSTKRMSRRLQDELDNFEALYVDDENPHLYAHVSELGSAKMENPMYESGDGLRARHDNTMYESADGLRASEDNALYEGVGGGRARQGMVNAHYAATGDAEGHDYASMEPSYQEITMLPGCRDHVDKARPVFMLPVAGDGLPIKASHSGMWRNKSVYVADGGDMFISVHVAPSQFRSGMTYRVCGDRDGAVVLRDEGLYVMMHENEYLDPRPLANNYFAPARRGEEPEYAAADQRDPSYMQVGRRGADEPSYLQVGKRGADDPAYLQVGKKDVEDPSYMRVARKAEDPSYMQVAKRGGPAETYLEVGKARGAGEGAQYLHVGNMAPASPAEASYMQVARKTAGDGDEGDSAGMPVYSVPMKKTKPAPPVRDTYMAVRGADASPPKSSKDPGQQLRSRDDSYLSIVPGEEGDMEEPTYGITRL